ncbi:hypothetical protein MRB53_005485 [Persea americana]|uniref:Uncharacterized protein n=1 Tax=Persea americana TaxID=3435 RepID=A0ACC2MD58_PERAE|nr:hypothetical protein MRB53_005485 [Persea americana]
MSSSSSFCSATETRNSGGQRQDTARRGSGFSFHLNRAGGVSSRVTHKAPAFPLCPAKRSSGASSLAMAGFRRRLAHRQRPAASETEKPRTESPPLQEPFFPNLRISVRSPTSVAHYT